MIEADGEASRLNCSSHPNEARLNLPKRIGSAVDCDSTEGGLPMLAFTDACLYTFPPMQLAHRVNDVADSITLAVSAKAKALKDSGVDVVGFGAGEPDFDTPDFIKNAAKLALDKGETKYTPSPCILPLKKAIVEKFKRDNNLTFEPNQITTGAGGKQCLYLAFMATLNPGDEVIVPSPYWVSYPEQIKLAGAKPVVVQGDENNDFKLTPQQLEQAITPKTRGFIINSPSNPAGHAYTPEELTLLAKVIAKYPNVMVFADEIYEKLVYFGQKSVSFATLDPSLPARTLTFNCHSKTYAMTGWRLGYVGGPKPVIDAMNKLQSQISSHVTSFIQNPGAVALTDPQGITTVEAMRVEFEQRGLHMWKRLSSLPHVKCVKPAGAFYCFPNVSAYFGKSIDGKKITDAISFSSILLDVAHVAVVPGNDSGFDTHVRLSFATSMQQIDKGLDRIEAFLKKLG
jgi:aspartate aminotransferase